MSFCSYVHVLGVRMRSFKMSAPLEIERSHIENNMQIQSLLGRLSNNMINQLLTETFELCKNIDTHKQIYSWYTYIKDITPSQSLSARTQSCTTVKHVKYVKTLMTSGMYLTTILWTNNFKELNGQNRFLDIKKSKS